MTEAGGGPDELDALLDLVAEEAGCELCRWDAALDDGRESAEMALRAAAVLERTRSGSAALICEGVLDALAELWLTGGGWPDPPHRLDAIYAGSGTRFEELARREMQRRAKVLLLPDWADPGERSALLAADHIAAAVGERKSADALAAAAGRAARGQPVDAAQAAGAGRRERRRGLQHRRRATQAAEPPRSAHERPVAQQRPSSPAPTLWAASDFQALMDGLDRAADYEGPGLAEQLPCWLSNPEAGISVRSGETRALAAA